MKTYVKEIWKKYHDHAPKWLQNSLTPCMAGAFIHDLFPLFPLSEVEISKYLFDDRSPLMIIPKYVIDKSKEYMDNPEKCTPSPWVYYTEKYFPQVDYKWIDTIIKGRTKNYEQITKDIYDGAVELSNVKKCFDLSDILKYIGEYYDKR